MISYKDALNTILDHANRLESKKVALGVARGHILADEVRAQIDVPPFDNSAMDGFALGSQHQEAKTFKIVGEIQAGQEPNKKIEKGEAVSIMTGATIPEGTETVVPIEKVKTGERNVQILEEVGIGANIRKRGEDIKKGSTLIEADTFLKPVHIGLAASVGVDKLSIIRKPRIAVVVTGDEIIKPGQPLKAGQIYDSNSYLLSSLIENQGFILSFKDFAKDSLEQTIKTLRKAIEAADVVLTTGGISVGKYDFVAEAFEKIGATCHFNKVKQKPGKPLAMFTVKDKIALSLPGNPVAVAVSFELHVRPMLLKMAGFKHLYRKQIRARMSSAVKKKKGRANFIRVYLTEQNGNQVASITGPQGSGILTSMLADGIVALEEETENISRGQEVKVFDLR